MSGHKGSRRVVCRPALSRSPAPLLTLKLASQGFSHSFARDRRTVSRAFFCHQRDALVASFTANSQKPLRISYFSNVTQASKYVSDLTKQTSKVGELRSAIADGSMTEADVYAEIGEVCNGSKPGREGKELIVVDLTGTGAQDAAIGQVAWDKLGN